MGTASLRKSLAPICFSFPRSATQYPVIAKSGGEFTGRPELDSALLAVRSAASASGCQCDRRGSATCRPSRPRTPLALRLNGLRREFLQLPGLELSDDSVETILEGNPVGEIQALTKSPPLGACKHGNCDEFIVATNPRTDRYHNPIQGPIHRLQTTRILVSRSTGFPRNM